HGGQKPFGPKEVETMSQTVSPSTSRSYGLARVSRRVACFARRRVPLSQGSAIACDRPSPDADLAIAESLTINAFAEPSSTESRFRRFVAAFGCARVSDRTRRASVQREMAVTGGARA